MGIMDQSRRGLGSLIGGIGVVVLAVVPEPPAVSSAPAQEEGYPTYDEYRVNRASSLTVAALTGCRPPPGFGGRAGTTRPDRSPPMTVRRTAVGSATRTRWCWPERMRSRIRWPGRSSPGRHTHRFCWSNPPGRPSPTPSGRWR